MKKIDLHFDEAIADSLSTEERLKERPLTPTIFSVFWIVTLLIASMAFYQVISLGIFNHDYYYAKALLNIRNETPIIAPRGIIVDRYGTPLVQNKPIFSVFLDIDEMLKRDEKEKVLSAIQNDLGIDKNLVQSELDNYDLERSQNLLIAEDITREQNIAIKGTNLYSLRVQEDYKRDYIRASTAHVIGYIGKTNSEDLKKNEDLTSSYTLGRSGLEAYYDDALRGKNGKRLIYRDKLGNIENVEDAIPPKIGNEIKTTIDGELQDYFYQRFSAGLRSLGRTSGVGIAINPKNGEVLSLISLPSFDPKNITASLNNPNQPLFNRAISGLYSPGSTIKPVHATAALKEKVVDPTHQILSIGYIEIPNPFDPLNPSRFVDWRPQGWVDVYSALARSSNVYFYEVGGGFEGLKGLGINRLIEYWQKFGLDKKTGIDLPAEASGFLPSPNWKEEKMGSIWRIGDTYNVSIGQGDLTITPIELLNTVVAIANRGKVYEPHILQNTNPKLLMDLSDLEPEFKEVRQGMRDGVTKDYGTSHLLADIPMKIAGKTGSAQIANNTKTNALFVGFSEEDNPEIAILILVENAKEGSLNVVPIAKDIMRWYYDNRFSKK